MWTASASARRGIRSRWILGVGRILHFGCEIMARASEKVLAVRERWAADNNETLGRLIRALTQASAFIDDAEQSSGEVAAVGGAAGSASKPIWSPARSPAI